MSNRRLTSLSAVGRRFTSACPPCTREREGIETTHEFTEGEMYLVLLALSQSDKHDRLCLAQALDDMEG